MNREKRGKMQETFPCFRCGSPSVIGQQFCIACGQRLQYVCPFCDIIVDPEFRFCTNCGAELAWGHTESQRVAKANKDEHSYKGPASIEDVLSYIVDKGVCELAAAFLKEVESWNDTRVTITAISSGISLKVLGRVFSYLWPARKSFTLSYYSRAGKWTDCKVTTEDSLKKAKRFAKQSLKYKLKD